MLPTARPDGVSLASADVSTLRTLIREELALAKKNSDPPVIRAPTAEPAATPTSPETVAEHRNALAEVDNLTAGGVWGDEQRIRFRTDLGLLNAEERRHAIHQLLTAVNTGVIKLHGRPPF
jgi:hypothetical protein